MSIPISVGSGAASVAAEAVGGLQYQQIEVLGRGGSSVLGVNPDGSVNVSVIGTINVTGSIIASGNQSVSGTVGASVIGWVPVQTSNTSVITVSQNSSIISVPTGNQSVSGALNVSGSVMLGSSNASVITRWADSSVVAVVTGSVVALPTGNQSISGSVNVGGSVLLGSSNASVITVSQGSIAAVIIGGSIAATVTPAANQSVSGAVTVAGSVLLGSSNASVIAYVPNSVATVIIGGSIAASFTPPANQSVSGAVNVSGSVLLGSSNASVITVWKDSSVLSVPVGSTIAVLQAASIIGTYAEDTAHTTGDKGLLSLAVRNDTLSSVTSADGDYSPTIVGPTGELVTANAPITKWIRGTADLRVVQGASVTAIAAQGASIFTYITGVQVVNFGSASVIVTLGGGLGSILGYTIAPAGGGSNIVYPNALKTGENSAFTASINGTASVLVSAQGFVAKV